MAELADAHGSGPCDYCSHEGSSPFSCMEEISREYLLIFFFEYICFLYAAKNVT